MLRGFWGNGRARWVFWWHTLLWSLPLHVLQGGGKEWKHQLKRLNEQIQFPEESWGVLPTSSNQMWMQLKATINWKFWSLLEKHAQSRNTFFCRWFRLFRRCTKSGPCWKKDANWSGSERGKGPVGTCRGNPRDGCDFRPMKIVVLAQAVEEMGHVEWFSFYNFVWFLRSGNRSHIDSSWLMVCNCLSHLATWAGQHLRGCGTVAADVSHVLSQRRSWSWAIWMASSSRHRCEQKVIKTLPLLKFSACDCSSVLEAFSQYIPNVSVWLQLLWLPKKALFQYVSMRS